MLCDVCFGKYQDLRIGRWSCEWDWLQLPRGCCRRGQLWLLGLELTSKCLRDKYFCNNGSCEDLMLGLGFKFQGLENRTLQISNEIKNCKVYPERIT